jgi:hypothetical protein
MSDVFQLNISLRQRTMFGGRSSQRLVAREGNMTMTTQNPGAFTVQQIEKYTVIEFANPSLIDPVELEKTRRTSARLSSTSSACSSSPARRSASS